MKNKVYYQDDPINNFKDDKIGFEEEVNMLKEGIEGNAKVIGMISDYGSGKSSIINLLENNINKKKYKFIRVNLFDISNVKSSLDAQKKMILQLASKRHKSKYVYYVNRFNENNKSARILLKNNFYFFLCIFAFILIVLSYFFNHGIINWIPNIGILNNNRDLIIDIIKCFGIIGISLLIIVLINSNVVFSFISKKNNDESKIINEYDLIGIFNELIYKGNIITVFVIEDLERNIEFDEINIFINSILSIYTTNNNVKFIISLTPNIFKEIVFSKKKSEINDDLDSLLSDEELKPFDLIVKLPSVCSMDYNLIIEDLIKDKRRVLKKYANINVDEIYKHFYILSKSKSKMNIRILKHRINSALHLFLTLKNRFPNVKNEYDFDIRIESCVAVAYLRNEYKDRFDSFINNKVNGEAKIKNFIKQYLSTGKNDFDPNYNDICADLAFFIDEGFINYNCDKYIYNYSKLNKIFDIYEATIYDCYVNNKPYNLKESTIDYTLNKNDMCLKQAIEDRRGFSHSLPDNIFENNIIFDATFKYLNCDEKKWLYLKLLPLDPINLDKTLDRINKISFSILFREENVDNYLYLNSHELLNKTFSEEEIINLRLRMIDYFISYSAFKNFYTKNFPLISFQEMKRINESSTIINLLCYENLTVENIKNVVNSFNNLNLKFNIASLKKFFSCLNSEFLDYVLKNLKCLKNLNMQEKEELLSVYDKFIIINDFNSLMIFINNTGFINTNIEKNVVKLVENGVITSDQFEEYLNSISTISDFTIDKLIDKDYFFRIPDFIIEKIKTRNIYEYIKFSSIRYGKIVVKKGKKYIPIYKKIYKDSRFDKLIPFSPEFIDVAYNNEFFKSCDLSRLFIMSFYRQNEELLEYAFQNLDSIELENYVSNIKIIDVSDEKMKKFIDKYIEKISNFSIETSNNFKNCLNNPILKSYYTKKRNKKKTNH